MCKERQDQREELGGAWSGRNMEHLLPHLFWRAFPKSTTVLMEPTPFWRYLGRRQMKKMDRHKEKVKNDNIWLCDKEMYFSGNVHGSLKLIYLYLISSKLGILKSCLTWAKYKRKLLFTSFFQLARDLRVRKIRLHLHTMHSNVSNSAPIPKDNTKLC